MSLTVLWTGPVSRMQARPSVPERFPLAVLPCTGDGSPRCQDHADAWRGKDGRRVPTMRQRLKLEGPFVIASFSAGGQIAKRIALDPHDRAEIRGMYLADATYTTLWRRPGELAGAHDGVTEGFVRYALDCIETGRPFVATVSSNPNKSYPSGAQTLAAIQDEIERQGGRAFQDASNDPMLRGLRAPRRAGRLFSVLFVDFGDVYQHGEHATVIAPLLLPRMLADIEGMEQLARAHLSPTPARDTDTTGSIPWWSPWAVGGVVVSALAWWWTRK